MTMAEVADVVGVHETTVSRAFREIYGNAAGTFEMNIFLRPGTRPRRRIVEQPA